ncbi:hypothetical protein IWQ61_010362 [Dispira simplex]|nr:hypothetical protein IWQ61_010362 [Dispira simplex]
MERLPIAVLTHYPAFSRLWTELQTILQLDIVPDVPLQEEFQATKTRWLQTTLLFNTVNDLANETECYADLDQTAQQLFETVGERIITYVAHRHRLPGQQGSKDQQPFGLKLSEPADPPLSDEAKKRILIHVDQVLKRRLGELTRLTFTTSPEGLKESADQLIHDIASERTRLNNLQKDMVDDFFEYLQLVMELLEFLWQAVTKHLLDHEIRKIDAFTGYFHSIIENIALKLKITYYGYLLEWYNPATSSALENLRNYFDGKEAHLLAQLREVGEQLVKYQSVGPEYEKLAEAFRETMRATELVQSDIQRIRP